MQARLAGVCPSCGGEITVGAAILWAPGRQAIHAGCGARRVLPDAAAAP